MTIRRRLKAQSDGSVLIHSQQDVEGILRWNQALYNSDQRQTVRASMGSVSNGSEMFVRVASIPLILVEQWMQAGYNMYSNKEDDWLKRRLNDSDYRKLRTAPGVI